MADEIVAKIKDAIDIVDLIGDSVRLERKGRNYGGLCPSGCCRESPPDRKTREGFVL